jgi:hypothetical protein
MTKTTPSENNQPTDLDDNELDALLNETIDSLPPITDQTNNASNNTESDTDDNLLDNILDSLVENASNNDDELDDSLDAPLPTSGQNDDTSDDIETDDDDTYCDALDDINQKINDTFAGKGTGSKRAFTSLLNLQPTLAQAFLAQTTKEDMSSFLDTNPTFKEIIPIFKQRTQYNRLKKKLDANFNQLSKKEKNEQYRALLNCCNQIHTHYCNLINLKKPLPDAFHTMIHKLLFYEFYWQQVVAGREHHFNATNIAVRWTTCAYNRCMKKDKKATIEKLEELTTALGTLYLLAKALHQPQTNLKTTLRSMTIMSAVTYYLLPALVKKLPYVENAPLAALFLSFFLSNLLPRLITRYKTNWRLTKMEEKWTPKTETTEWPFNANTKTWVPDAISLEKLGKRLDDQGTAETIQALITMANTLKPANDKATSAQNTLLVSAISALPMTIAQSMNKPWYLLILISMLLAWPINKLKQLTTTAQPSLDLKEKKATPSLLPSFKTAVKTVWQQRALILATILGLIKFVWNNPKMIGSMIARSVKTVWQRSTPSSNQQNPAQQKTIEPEYAGYQDAWGAEDEDEDDASSSWSCFGPANC